MLCNLYLRNVLIDNTNEPYKHPTKDMSNGYFPVVLNILYTRTPGMSRDKMSTHTDKMSLYTNKCLFIYLFIYRTD